MTPLQSSQGPSLLLTFPYHLPHPLLNISQDEIQQRHQANPFSETKTKKEGGWLAWVAQSVQRQTSAQIMISWFEPLLSA